MYPCLSFLLCRHTLKSVNTMPAPVDGYRPTGVHAACVLVFAVTKARTHTPVHAPADSAQDHAEQVRPRMPGEGGSPSPPSHPNLPLSQVRDATHLHPATPTFLPRTLSTLELITTAHGMLWGESTASHISVPEEIARGREWMRAAANGCCSKGKGSVKASGGMLGAVTESYYLRQQYSADSDRKPLAWCIDGGGRGRRSH